MQNGLQIALATEAKNILIARYLAIATVAVVVYEYLLTFDDEILLFWSSRRQSAVKAVLFVNRYAPFITSLLFLYVALLQPGHFELCKPIAIVIGCLSYLSTAASECILILRIYILWEQKKKVLILLLSLFTFTMVIISIVLYRVSGSFQEMGIRPYASGCVLFLFSKMAWITFFVLLIQEIIFLYLVMLRDARCQEQNTFRKISRILVNDGQLYYTFMIAVTLTNLLVNTLVPNPPPFYGAVLEAVLHNVLCMRLSAHLIKVNQSTSSQTISRAEPSTSSRFVKVCEWMTEGDKPTENEEVEGGEEG